MRFFKVYVIAFIVFVVLDLLSVRVIAKEFYQEQIGHLMANNINWLPEILLYLIYIFGLVYFAIIPALKHGNWFLLILNGAIFGLVSYATYDLTNLATLKDWPIKFVVYDLVWGAFVSDATCLITYGLASSWKIPN